jgi:hypothetical protein
MRRAIAAATRDELVYQAAARALGCVICRFRIERGMQSPVFGQCGPTQVHHRNLDDKHGAPQLGQGDIVALGAWHHEGDQLPGLSRERMRGIFGPSFKHHARDFRIWTADVLGPGGTAAWQQYQDRLLGRGLSTT